MVKINGKMICLGTYAYNSDVLSSCKPGQPCKRVGFSYEPLWNSLEKRGLTLAEVKRMIGLSDNVAADLSLDRRVSLDMLGIICYYLGLRIEQVVELEYIDSEITEADIHKATSRKMAAEARWGKKDTAKEKARKTEPLLASALHTPIHSFNLHAIIAEQRRQEAQETALPPEGDTSTAEEEKPL